VPASVPTAGSFLAAEHAAARRRAARPAAMRGRAERAVVEGAMCLSFERTLRRALRS
jgi:hypothetical protein